MAKVGRSPTGGLAARCSPKFLLKDGMKGGSSIKSTGLPVTGKDEVGVLNTLRGLKGSGRYVTDRQPWAGPVIGPPLSAEWSLLGTQSPSGSKTELKVTNATRHRFLKTNPRAFNCPVIASEQSQ
jgi:hypothetical protein